MKLIFSLFAISLILLSLSVPLNAQTALVTATGEWAPYVSQSLEQQGFITEIITEVYHNMGVEPRYVFYPWRRCYDSVKAGKVWAAFPYSYTENRAAEVMYSDKISFSVTKFFVYGENGITAYETIDDLKKLRIGGVIGYFYEEDFERHRLNVDYSPNEESAIEKLMLGRTDILPLNELVGWYLIQTRFPDFSDQFHALEKPYSSDDLHMIVSKSYSGSEALLHRFNKSLRLVKDNYIYQSVLDRYKLK